MRIYSLVILIFFVEVTCRHSVAAANDAVCEATSATATCEPGVGEENNMSSWEFMNAFSKLGTSWNHVIGECTCAIYTLCSMCLILELYILLT